MRIRLLELSHSYGYTYTLKEGDCGSEREAATHFLSVYTRIVYCMYFGEPVFQQSLSLTAFGHEIRTKNQREENEE